MLTGTNFESSDLSFTAVVRSQNALIGIPLDYLHRSDAVGKYTLVWNNCEENLKLYASLWGQAFKYYTETLYSLLVQYLGTYGTSRNTVSHHTRINDGNKFYPKMKGRFKTEAYEEAKASKANNILKRLYYYENRKFIIKIWS